MAKKTRLSTEEQEEIRAGKLVIAICNLAPSLPSTLPVGKEDSHIYQTFKLEKTGESERQTFERRFNTIFGPRGDCSCRDEAGNLLHLATGMYGIGVVTDYLNAVNFVGLPLEMACKKLESLYLDLLNTV